MAVLIEAWKENIKQLFAPFFLILKSIYITFTLRLHYFSVTALTGLGTVAKDKKSLIYLSTYLPKKTRIKCNKIV